MTAPTSNTDSLGNTPSGMLPRSRFAPPPTEPDPFWSPPDTSPLIGPPVNERQNDMAGIKAIKYRVGGPVSSGEVTS